MAHRLLLGFLMALCAAAACAATPPTPKPTPTPTLEQRMQLFREGSLRGFALAELPDDSREIYTEADFKDLAATGANVARVAIQLRRCKGCDHYDMPEADVAYAERILRRGERHGFRVVLVVLATPWGNQSDYWDEPKLKADIVKKWGLIARRLKAFPALVAYDLINEPVVPQTLLKRSAQTQWHELALAIATELRATDPDTPLLVEPTPWGLPSSFWRTEALDLTGIVYSFHFYEPREFTHQGLPDQAAAVAYPSKAWDKSQLSQAMNEARRFAAQHKVPMFVGEFSCVRWAPAGSCPRYLADAIALFEAEGWGWAYHCWRCYQGWDAEVPQDVPQAQRAGYLPEQRRANSASVSLLKKAMQRNRKTASN
jgi:endoglucanase